MEVLSKSVNQRRIRTFNQTVFLLLLTISLGEYWTQTFGGEFKCVKKQV